MTTILDISYQGLLSENEDTSLRSLTEVCLLSENEDTSLRSLTEVEIPDTVTSLYCNGNKLTDFVGINKNVKIIHCHKNNINSWKGLEGMHIEFMNISLNPIATTDKMPKIDRMICGGCEPCPLYLPILTQLRDIKMVDFKNMYMTTISGVTIDIKRCDKITLFERHNSKDEIKGDSKIWWEKGDKRKVYHTPIIIDGVLVNNIRSEDTWVVKHEDLEKDSPYLTVFEQYNNCKRIWID